MYQGFVYSVYMYILIYYVHSVCKDRRFSLREGQLVSFVFKILTHLMPIQFILLTLL